VGVLSERKDGFLSIDDTPQDEFAVLMACEAFKLKGEGFFEILQIDLNCLFIEHVCHRSKKPPQNKRYCLALSVFYTILPKNMANRVKIFIDGKVVNLV